jgi:asparaginyl-tRNA synthetase
MIEPEMAFYDLGMNMDLAEAMMRFIVTEVMAKRPHELQILNRDLSFLEKVTKPFPRITYTDAIEMLRSETTMQLLRDMEQSRLEERAALQTELPAIEKEMGSAKKFRKTQIEARIRDIRARFEEIEEDLRNIPVWRASAQEKTFGDDLGGSDETLLTMQFDTPIMVWGYPSAIKAFYMKRDPNNDAIALGVDMLAPEGYGEIIGGGQREEDINLLLERIKEHDLPEEVFSWYLDLRRYGSVPHSGFGLGLERTVAWICGLKHVRETIPFPRMLGRLTP